MPNVVAPNAVTPSVLAEYCTFLWCIAVDDTLKVLLEPFQLCTPQNDPGDTIPTFLKIAFPILRGKDHAAFRLLRAPPDSITTNQLQGAQLSKAQVNTRSLVHRTTIVKNQFPLVLENAHGHVNVIIYILATELGAYYFILPAKVLTLSNSDHISTAVYSAHKLWRHPSRHDTIEPGEKYLPP